jgi:predicted permease
MTPFARLRSLAAGLLLRQRVENSLSDEIRFHIASYRDDLVRSGVPAGEAERRARIEFGGVETYKDQCREARGLRLLDDLRADLRYAVRTLARSPSFCITAILTLALGIGANTGFFTLVDTLLLRPTPVRDPQSLYQILGHVANRVTFASFSGREYRDVVAANSVFAQVIADSALRARLQGRHLGGYLVSANYFQDLGGGVTAGRPILADDELPSAPPVLVLQHAAWQQKWNADRGIVGKIVELSGHPFTVIGVAAPGFTGIDAQVPDFWAPLSAGVLLTAKTDERSLRLIGRLRPGVSPEQAQSAISVLLPRITESRRQELRLVDASLQSRATYQNWNHADPANVLPVLTAFVLVLLIACTNLSNVLLARSWNRRHEISIRLSLGAARSRIVRQLLTETAVLSLVAGLAGLVISRWSLTLIRRLLVSAFSQKTGMSIIEVNPDFRVFAFAMLLSLAAGIAFGLVPALHATQSHLAAAPRRSLLRDGLVIAQFSLSLVLLIGAGLLVRSSIKFAAVQPGIDIARTLSVEPVQETGSAAPAFYSRLAARLQAIPGVTVVAPVLRQPLRGSLPLARVSTGMRDWKAGYNEVAPPYFSALGIAIQRGRAFTAQEPAAAVISESTTRHFWPGQDPLGKSFEITTSEFSSTRTVRVVGIAKDVISAWLWDGVDPTCIYLPAQSSHSPDYAMLLRVTGDPGAFLPILTRTLSSVDPATEFDIRTMAQLMDSQILPFRLASYGAAALGLLGLTLASIGIYGVMAYSMSQRRREIGIRMALGADSSRVLRMNLREGFRLIAIAAACGLLAASALSRVMRAMMFRVDVNDALTFAIAPLALGLIGLLAVYFPSRKAASIDPNVALRYE